MANTQDKYIIDMCTLWFYFFGARGLEGLLVVLSLSLSPVIFASLPLLLLDCFGHADFFSASAPPRREGVWS